jgi:putative ATP-dependent endonuclease of OLD family
MARASNIRIQNFRSIGDLIEIDFPVGVPVVLVGENNAGKSNIVRSVDLILGQWWPGTHDPEDHEFHLRERQTPIKISVRFDPADLCGGRYREIRWRYDSADEEPLYFRGLPGQYGEDGYVSKDDRTTCSCIVIEADRNLNYHLGYSSKFTLLSRLMHRFHNLLTEDPDTRQRLTELFAQVRARFNAIQPFADFTTILSDRLGDFAQNMPHRLEVDFEAYNPTNFFHALRLHALEGTEPRTLAEMGTGEQQVLALAFAYAYANAFHEGVFLVIEEPESHLHPLAQQWLADRLATMCVGGLQILLTTHSSHFINLLGLPGLVVVRKQPYTRVTQRSTAELVEHCIATGAPADRTTVENILAFYQANATPEILEGFLARAVVLVEGRTEALAVPQLLARCGLQHTQEGVAVVPVQGKGNLGKWYRLFTAYGIPCYVIFDNDTPDDRDGVKRRDALIAIGIPPDRYDAIVGHAEWVVSDRYSVFGIDFETTLRAALPGYPAAEEEARAQGVDSKPFVARWALGRLEPDDSVGWNTARQMATAIRAVLPQRPQVAGE